MSHWIMGVFAAICSLVGLFMASGAHDFGIAFFGIALMIWGVLFCWFMIKTAYDELEQESGGN